MPWIYVVNLQNTHAEVWPQQDCIATLLKSLFGTEATPHTRRLLPEHSPMKISIEDYFWKENCIYEKHLYNLYTYIYVYSTGRKRLVNGSYCSKFQFGKRASVKQLFTNYLGLRINSFTNLQLWRNWREKKKKKCVAQTLVWRNSKS